MTLNQLRYLVAIVDAGLVISRAAGRVHTTQSALSKQLKQIEAGMGQPLFLRRGYALCGLTPCGSRVLEHARAVLAEMSGIRSLVLRRGGGPGRVLRVATTPTQARYVLPAALERLTREHSQLQVSLRVGADAEVLTLAGSGEIDLALANTPGLRPRHVAAVPLYRWQRVALVPTGHTLLQLRRGVAVADLAAYPLMTHESAPDPLSDVARAFAMQRLRPNLAVGGDADLIKAYVRAGLGVGIVAETAYRRESDADLCALPLGDLFPACTAWAAFPARIAPAEPALELVADLARHVDIRALRRTLALGEAGEWPAPPAWAAVAPRAVA